MQIISKVVQKVEVQEKLIRRPLEFFRQRRKNRGDGLGGCATQCQSGRSMIEMLGVLAIIGVLSVGGIIGYSKAMHRYKVNKTIEQVTYAAHNIRTLFARERNYEDWCDFRVYRKARIFYEEMWQGNDPYGVWGNEIGFSSAGPRSDGTGSACGIEWRDIPNDEICIDLLTHDWKNSGIDGIGVYYNDDTYNVWFAAKDTPVNVATAVESCHKMDDYDYTIIFGFGDYENI